MMRNRIRFTAIALAVVATGASAQSGDVFRIGTIVDASGPYSALAGPGVTEAVKMAVEDFGGTVNGKKIEVLMADSLNKADVAVAKAREWIDRENVKLIVEGSDSGVGLGLQKLGASKKTVTIMMSGSTLITNEECSPYGVQYVWNTHALAKGSGSYYVKNGFKDWYFISANYNFGKTLEAETTKVITELGANKLGSTSHPVNSTDLASQILSAKNSGATMVALANAGIDAQNSIRQARSFGLTNAKTKVAPLMFFDTDVKALGLRSAQGTAYVTSFYWDMNAKTREFSERFFKRQKAMPTMTQAGAYSAVMHYLNVAQKLKTDDADKVMEGMRATPVNDFFVQNGVLRKDGQLVRDMYMVQAKTPEESKSEWDILKVVATIPAADAFQSRAESKCPLFKE